MPVSKKKKTIKKPAPKPVEEPVEKTGFAEKYTPIKDTLDLPLARVQFNKQKITIHKKDGKGALTNKKLNVVFQTPHGAAVVYGRLKKDTGEYLLALMRKTERDQEEALYRSQRASIGVKLYSEKK